MQDIVSSQVTASAVVVLLIQWLKSSRFAPWITGETDTLNKALGALFAAFTAVGIHATYDSSAHVLTIAGLTLGAFFHGAWHWLQSFSFQQLIYHGAMKPVMGPHPLPDVPVKGA